MRIQYVILFTIVAMIALTGCDKESGQKIPSYIHIDTIRMRENPNVDEGSISHNITDAWLYVDNQFIGVFELPATIPVLEEGKKKVVVRPGIMMNGISSTRIPYPFFKEYTLESVMLEKEEIDTLQPVVEYVDDIAIPFREDFEGESLHMTYKDSDTTFIIENNQPYEGIGSGKVVLEGSKLLFQAVSDTSYKLPYQGQSVFLELNFKTNTNVSTGLIAITDQGENHRPIVGLNPTDHWKKIYINLTHTIGSSYPTRNFKVFLSILRKDDEPEAEVYFDNLKVIHLDE